MTPYDRRLGLLGIWRSLIGVGRYKIVNHSHLFNIIAGSLEVDQKWARFLLIYSECLVSYKPDFYNSKYVYYTKTDWATIKSTDDWQKLFDFRVKTD